MSSTPANQGKKEWLCILPDQDGAFERRMKVRPEHLEKAKPMVDDGTLPMGGAILDKHPNEGEQMKIKGSVMVLLAETREEAEKILKDDVYGRNDVWDFSKTQIMPFKSAFRVGL